MTDSEDMSDLDRQACVTRYGEYQHIPIARCGPFRVDRRRFRHFTTGEIELPAEMVFEIDASTEFVLVGASAGLCETGVDGTRLVRTPSASEILRRAATWFARIADPRGTSIARYQRRVGGMVERGELIPGEWHIDPIFKLPDRPWIDLTEAVRLVEVALISLGQLGVDARGPDKE